MQVVSPVQVRDERRQHKPATSRQPTDVFTQFCYNAAACPWALQLFLHIICTVHLPYSHVIMSDIQEVLLPQTDYVSVKILPNAAQQCRNNLYDKFRTNDSNGVRGLQSTCAFSHDKLTVVGVIYKLTVDENCWPHQYSDNFLWRNFLSLKCRNESRDPNHAHLGNSYSSEG